jgi:hypothetical protein
MIYIQVAHRRRVQPAAVTINETGGDSDFRVESDGNTHALFVQGSDGNVGIGTSTITNPYSQTDHTDVNLMVLGRCH